MVNVSARFRQLQLMIIFFTLRRSQLDLTVLRYSLIHLSVHTELAPVQHHACWRVRDTLFTVFFNFAKLGSNSLLTFWTDNGDPVLNGFLIWQKRRNIIGIIHVMHKSVSYQICASVCAQSHVCLLVDTLTSCTYVAVYPWLYPRSAPFIQTGFKVINCWKFCV